MVRIASQVDKSGIWSYTTLHELAAAARNFLMVSTVPSNKSALYHKDVYAPAVFFRSPGVVRLRYSYHARDAARDDRYGDLSRYLTPYRDFDDGEIVEIELDAEGQIAKRLVRFTITDELVLVMAVSSDGYVKTVWCNRIVDRHATLDPRKYVQRPRILASA